MNNEMNLDVGKTHKKINPSINCKRGKSDETQINIVENTVNSKEQKIWEEHCIVMERRIKEILKSN